MRQPADKYGPIAILLHWLIAAGVVAAVGFGLTTVYADSARVTRATVLIHQSIGTALFALVLFRALWRVTHPAPPLPAAMPRAQKVAAAVTHGSLYVMLFALPITGYIKLAAFGRDITVFGLFNLPNLMPQDRELSVTAQDLHAYGQYVLYALVALHVGAALYHQFVLKDGLLRRMLPELRR
jgi:cytochrome b561